MDHYSIIYSSSVDGADGVIEKMLMNAQHPERIVVVTNDGLIRNCAYANGSTAMRAKKFSNGWIMSSKVQIRSGINRRHQICTRILKTKSPFRIRNQWIIRYRGSGAIRLHTDGGDGVAKDLERNRFSDR